MTNKIQQMVDGAIVSAFKKYPQLTPTVLLGGVAAVCVIVPIALMHWPIIVVGGASYYFVKTISAVPAWLEKLQRAANGEETVEAVDVTPAEEK